MPTCNGPWPRRVEGQDGPVPSQVEIGAPLFGQLVQALLLPAEIELVSRDEVDRLRYAAADRVSVASRQAAAETSLYIAGAELWTNRVVVVRLRAEP